MSDHRVRPLRLLLALLALLASLLLASFHAGGAHHVDFAGPACAALVAAQAAGSGHGSAAALDPDTCSLCRVVGQARSLLVASDRLAPGDQDRAARRGLPPVAAQSPDEHAVAVAGPRAPPSLLQS